MTRYVAVLFGLMGVAWLAILGLGCGRSDILDYSTNFDGGPGFDGAPGLDGGPGFDALPPTGCKINLDCASAPATPYCELPEGICVACLTSPDTCPAGELCAPTTHQCVPSACKGTGCPIGTTCCGSTCADINADPANCGGCGERCAAGATCQSGACCVFSPGGGGVCTNPTCPLPLESCGGSCVDERTDRNNCGACGDVCALSATCDGGVCTSPASCNGGPQCAGADQCCLGGCSDTTTDPDNCGECQHPCPIGGACVGGACAQPPCNGGPACTGNEACCTAGCISVQSDPSNCGSCGHVCSTGTPCIDGSCVVNQGGFDPIVNPTFLSPGVHSFTTINIPAGVTVYVAGGDPGSGTLDLDATGDIVIDGTIDLSGGPGTENTITSQSTDTGRAGSGGFTGEPYASAPQSAACEFIAGNPGSLGFALAGTPGTCAVLSTTTCTPEGGPGSLLFTSPVAQYGGGAGIFTGFRAYGSGGGGPAGGAPGALGAPYPGEQDCSGVSGGGGAVNGAGGLGGGSPYNGRPGVSGQTQCPGLSAIVPPAFVGGGGGGSIGALAASDLAVVTTFQTGSGGGGGSADYLNRPVFGGTSGGGGGGGALRLTSATSITIGGQVLANGGAGGDAGIGNGQNANCDPQPGAGGGGGAGGVIYLSAPAITVGTGATVSAAGGPGGAQSEFATGGGGGAGGMGRIRLSVTPSTCSLNGSFTPALASVCAPTNKPGAVYIGVYPN